MNKFTNTELDAMRRRLRQKQEDRKAEADMDEAIALASRKTAPFGQAPTAQIEAEAVEPVEKKMSMAVSILLIAGYGVVEAMRRMTVSDGLVVLILWLIGLVVYGLRIL